MINLLQCSFKSRSRYSQLDLSETVVITIDSNTFRFDFDNALFRGSHSGRLCQVNQQKTVEHLEILRLLCSISATLTISVVKLVVRNNTETHLDW